MFRDESPQVAIGHGRRVDGVDGELVQSTQGAICRLLTAYNYAVDTGRSPWEFAVTIGEILRDGVSENELRWLACRGYVDHAQELPSTGSERAFDRHVSLRLGKRSAFVITSLGVAFSHELFSSLTEPVQHNNLPADTIDCDHDPAGVYSTGNGCRPAPCAEFPKWDRDRRELRLGERVIKVFKLPSPMQEAILVAFEEEHWPPRIDDPLPSHPELLPKRRLHDTIKSLNRNQKNSLIRFMGDGTGEGIRWELCAGDFSSDLPTRHLH
jgi:hypothetical protein